MEDRAAHFCRVSQQIVSSIESVVDGQSRAVRLAVMVFLAQGHLLIEDVPGVGKTVLAKALARSVGGDIRRVQFTPDLMPSDVTGVSIYDQQTHEFRFTPGPLFANLVIGDEINRASAKTQAALLEAMEEHQVSVDGVTHDLPMPFTVIATQNPIELDGTFPLPEAQRDRFMARIHLGYPDLAAELTMVHDREAADPLDALGPVVVLDEIRTMIAYARSLYVAEAVERYALTLVRSTREHPNVRLGASPRATLQLLRAAKVCAAMNGRNYVVPDDVASVASPVLAHRLIAAHGWGPAHEGNEQMQGVIGEVLQATPVPRSASA